MVTSVGFGSSGLPTQTITNTDQTVATANQSTGTSADLNMNQYTPQQQLMQGQAGSFISNILAGGQVPQSFGLPQSVYDAAFHNFNKYQAPQLAAQHGAGSPAMNASAQELNLQLAGMAGQRSTGNALDAFSQAANFAFKPIGAKAEKVSTAGGTQNEVLDKTTNEIGIDYGGLLGAIFGMLPGGGFSLPPNPFGSV